MDAATMSELISVPSVDMSDCFGCYPGGLGVPVICDFGEHFDQTGSSEFFSPRSAMHTGCDTNQCSEHSACQEGEETIASLTAAVASHDLNLLYRLIHDDDRIEVNHERMAIQVLDCTGEEVVFHLPLDVSLALALR